MGITFNMRYAHMHAWVFGPSKRNAKHIKLSMIPKQITIAGRGRRVPSTHLFELDLIDFFLL